MSIRVELQIERTALIAEESPACRLIVTNTGPAAVTVASPEMNPEVPALRVIETRTGLEKIYRRKAFLAGTAYVVVGPQKSLDYTFPLRDIARIAIPLEYDVAAVVPWDNGTKLAESNLVRVKIEPVTPKSLAVASCHAGWSAAQYAVAVNVTSDPPRVVRFALEVKPEGGVADARPVADATIRTRPLLSTSMNNRATHSHWIVWQDGDSLACTHFEATAGALPTRRWRLPAGESAIATPIYSAPEEDPAARPDGDVLFWTSDAGRSTLQVLHLTAAGDPQSAGSSIVPGGLPHWSVNAFRGDGSRLVFYARTEQGANVLYTQPWPGQRPPQPGGQAPAARRLESWPGDPLAGDVLVGDDDTVLGATLLREPKAAGANLQLITWSLDTKGVFRANKPRRMNWDFNSRVAIAIVRVAPDGTAAALISDGTTWHLYHRELAPLAAGLAQTRLPIDLTFLDPANPVLLVGRVNTGIDVVMADGSPLPHKCG